MTAVGDLGERSAAERGQLAQEGRVGGRADRHREEATAAEIRVEEADGCLLVLDLAVGGEDHLRHEPPRRRVAERDLKGREQVRAAVRLKTGDEAARLLDGVAAGRNAR